MPGYDPKVHESLAELLATRAKRITMVYTVMAAITGGGVGAILGFRYPGHFTRVVFLATLIMTLLGFVAGKERKFKLSLKSQELLWQKQVEEDLRANAGTMATGATAK